MPTYPFRFIFSRADAPDALAHALLEIWGATPTSIERKVLDATSIDTREAYGTQRTVRYAAAGAQVQMQTWEHENQGALRVSHFAVTAPDCHLQPHPEDTTCYTLEAPAASAQQVFKAIFPRFGHDPLPQVRLPYLLAGTDPQLLVYRIGNQPPTPQGTATALGICTQHRAAMPEYAPWLLKATAHQCRHTNPGLQIELLDEALALDTTLNGPDAAPGYWATLIRAEAERGNLPEAERRATTYLATALPAHRPVCGEVCRLMGELAARHTPTCIAHAQEWYRRGANQYGNETCLKMIAG